MLNAHRSPIANRKVSPSVWFGNSHELVGQGVGELAPFQMTLPETLDVRRRIGQPQRTRLIRVRVDQHNALSQVIPHVSHGTDEVGVVRHDDRLFVLVVESIDEESSDKVNIRAFLF